MRSARFRWLLPLLRYGLCAVAVIFLVYSVTWHDYVHLNDAAQTPLRLVRQDGDRFSVLEGGQEVIKPVEELRHAEVNGREIVDIEYGLPGVVQRTDHVLTLWAVLIFLPTPLMCAVRLIWMLRIQQVRLSFWESVKFTLAGNFFNFALPGTTGGDLIKAWYITHFTHRKTEAVTTVFLDRAIGLLSLVLMAGAMIVLTRDPSQFGQLGLTLALICLGLAAGAVVVFSRRIRRALRLGELVLRLPMSEQLRRIGQATLAMRQHKTLVVLSLLITFALQTVAMISAVVMARALGMEGSFAYFFIYIAIGFVVAAIPIAPPQAIGVLEYFYVVCFTAGGQNTASQAVTLAVCVRLIQLVWSLPGVLVPLLGAHLPKRAELQDLQQPEDQPRDEPADGPARPVDQDKKKASGRPAPSQFHPAPTRP
jgi:uncharacterized protein (TIRG00374 family)